MYYASLCTELVNQRAVHLQQQLENLGNEFCAGQAEHGRRAEGTTRVVACKLCKSDQSNVGEKANWVFKYHLGHLRANILMQFVSGSFLAIDGFLATYRLGRYYIYS